MRGFRKLGLFALAASALWAQPNRDFFPWWEMPVARDLNLSEDQMRQINATVRDYRDRLIDLRGGVEKAENQLSDLINEENPDEKRVNAAIERLITARGELTRAFTQMGFKLRMVLTPRQWGDLQRRRPRPPGPGEPMPKRRIQGQPRPAEGPRPPGQIPEGQGQQ
jgi:Spy/CpxP family protein refolding chaperone